MNPCTRLSALSLAAGLAVSSLALAQAPTHSAMDPQNSPAAQAGEVGGRTVPPNMKDMAGSMQADQVINSQLAKWASMPEEAHDMKVALMAGCSNMEEIEFSKAVLEKATDPKVKEIATLIVKEHQMAQDKLKPIGEKLGVQYPTQLPAMKQAQLMGLRNMPADKMQKAYLSMMKAGHLMTVNNLTDHLPMIKDADLKAWTSETLPKIRAHTAEVLKTAADMGMPTDLKFESSDNHNHM